MYKIVIVEDSKDAAAQLEAALRQYAAEYKLPFDISIFYNAVPFLERYTAEWDIVFMDILMPLMNGLDASRILREKDGQVMLIFVTSMQQYAIHGYEVEAADFIVKPIRYPEFKLKFTRSFQRLQSRKPSSVDILIKTETGVVRLFSRQISYVEVRAHHCVYHTASGEFRQYQTMKSVEALLEPCGFARCNNFLLVNLAHVTRIAGMSVFVGDTELQISHPRKNEFTRRFEEFSGSKKYG